MKKILVPILFLVAVAAVAAGIFLAKQKQRPPVPAEPAGIITAGKEGSVPQQEAAGPQAPKQSSAPFEVYFTAPTPPKISKGQPVLVTLQVASIPEKWPAEVGPEARLDLLLRLPFGVKLASEQGWSPSQVPPMETDAITGPWNVYEKQVPAQIQQGVPPKGPLAVEKVELIVAEEGINWIITARARLTQGSKTWQTFGAVFATLQGNDGEFHGIPKTSADTLSTQNAPSAKES